MTATYKNFGNRTLPDVTAPRGETTAESTVNYALVVTLIVIAVACAAGVWVRRSSQEMVYNGIVVHGQPPPMAAEEDKSKRGTDSKEPGTVTGGGLRMPGQNPPLRFTRLQASDNDVAVV